MYFVLYDKNLNPIGNPYKLEKWSRTQRAVDFDNLKIVGAEINLSRDPFLVVVNNKHGNMLFSGLVSTPTIDAKAKRTSIILKDYLTLLNSEIIINLSEFSGTNLHAYIEFILNSWSSQIDVGFSTDWNISVSLSLMELSHNIKTGTQSINVCNHILGLLDYYGVYVICDLNIPEKKIIFKFNKNGQFTLPVKLSDFEVGTIEKSFGECNRATVYNHVYEKKQEWALTIDNEVVKLPSPKPLVYPAKNKNFIAKEPNDNLDETSAVNNAAYDAVMELSKNRYQETIELDAKKTEALFNSIPFDYFAYYIDVYTDDGFYKKFPIGEIITDSDGKHILKLGFRIQELTQEI